MLARNPIPTTKPSGLAYPHLRVLALLWLCVYIPTYAITYGSWHFLYLCNIGITTTALGLVFGSQMLLSSQALVAPGIALLWVADATSRLLTGHYLYGGTAYMWDASIPLFTRLLSLYHVIWPALLYYCLRRHGYDRRALGLQCVLVATAIALALLVAPAVENIDYVHKWPGATMLTSQPLVHAVELLGIFVVGFCWPLHRICRAMFRPAANTIATPAPANMDLGTE